jgi:hypothetical protein
MQWMVLGPAGGQQKSARKKQGLQESVNHPCEHHGQQIDNHVCNCTTKWHSKGSRQLAVRKPIQYRRWFETCLNGIIQFLIFQFFLADLQCPLFKITFPCHELLTLILRLLFVKATHLKHPNSSQDLQNIKKTNDNVRENINTPHSLAQLFHHEPSLGCPALLEEHQT